jgi:hypothetical protein
MCVLNLFKRRINQPLSSNDAYKKIAYIQVLEYAAKEARGASLRKH